MVHERQMPWMAFPAWRCYALPKRHMTETPNQATMHSAAQSTATPPAASPARTDAAPLFGRPRVSSLITEHLIVVHEHQVDWATRLPWTHKSIWREQTTGEVLEACATLLKQAPRGRLRRFDRVTVLFGFPHVVYADLPWSDGLYSDADWQAYARALLTERLGVRFDTARVVIEHAAFGKPRLVAAVQGELCDSLQTLFASAGLRLQHAVPLAMAAARHYWWELPRNGVLAVPEPGALTCFFRQADAWRGACSLRVSEQAKLSDNLLTAQLLSGSSSDTVLVADHNVGYEQDAQTPPLRWLGRAHLWQGAA
jgi:hypothetical protein